MLCKNVVKNILVFVFSPTYLWSIYWKKKLNTRKERTYYIKFYNTGYLFLSLSVMLFLMLCSSYLVIWKMDFYMYILFLIWLIPLSRINEIFIAFISDALNKVDNLKPASTLTFSDRIRLALKSYLELVINFGLIFYLMPNHYFDNLATKDNESFSSLFDAIYYSGVTITTLGYGDFSPYHWLSQFLSVYEVFCGFILLIVSFTIYVGRGLIITKET